MRRRHTAAPQQKNLSQYTTTPTTPTTSKNKCHPSPVASRPIITTTTTTTSASTTTSTKLNPKNVDRIRAVSDYLWCEICGKEFQLVEDPLEQENMWLVHFTSEHLLDELQTGSVTLEDLKNLEKYFHEDDDNDDEWKEDEWKEDLFMLQAKVYRKKVERRKFWFAIFFTLIVFVTIYRQVYQSSSSSPAL